MVLPWRVTVSSHLTVDQTLHAIGRVTEHTGGVSPFNFPEDCNTPKLLFGTIDYTRHKFRLRQDLSPRTATIYQGYVDYHDGKCYIWVWARPTIFATIIICVLLFFFTQLLLKAYLNPADTGEMRKTVIWTGIIYLATFLFTYLEVRSTKKLFLNILSKYK